MPEGLSLQARIDLGPDDTAAELAIGGIFAQAREVILREGYHETPKVLEMLGVEVVEPLIADGTLLAYQDHGDQLFPTFQFHPETNQPLETVSRVNRILDAPSDGWGVTAWWVQRNAYLPEAAAPRTLLGTPGEYAAVQLAEAVVKED